MCEDLAADNVMYAEVRTTPKNRPECNITKRSYTGAHDVSLHCVAVLGCSECWHSQPRHLGHVLQQCLCVASALRLLSAASAPSDDMVAGACAEAVLRGIAAYHRSSCESPPHGLLWASHQLVKHVVSSGNVQRERQWTPKLPVVECRDMPAAQRAVVRLLLSIDRRESGEAAMETVGSAVFQSPALTTCLVLHQAAHRALTPPRASGMHFMAQ